MEGVGLNNHWIEIAKNLNNKGLGTLESFWDFQNGDWKSLEQLKLCINLSLHEGILVGRLLEKVSNLTLPPIGFKSLEVA